MGRFAFAAVFLVLLSSGAAGGVRAEPASLAAEWAKYRDHFVTADGRVLDTGNHVVSHSEGQGWAMLFAESANDRASFARLWEWTRTRLQHRQDALFSWQWNPFDDKNPIADTNDAADGDLLIGWALARASRRWNHPEYRQEAARIIADVRRHLVRTADGGRLVLLPGAQGFVRNDGTLTLNPSYYVYPAFRDFARIDRSPVWARLRRDGLALLATARFGRWGLPADWLELRSDGGVKPSPLRPARFGFDAIRVPLYLAWAGEATPDRVAGMVAFWDSFPDQPIPAWADLGDNSVAPYPAPPGFKAVIDLVDGLRTRIPPPLPTVADGDNYYSASLTLLARMARTAIRR